MDLLEADVREKLGALRRALSNRLALEGAAWIVAALVAVVFCTLGLDYGLRLERPLRIAIMAAALLVLAVVAWRRLIMPLRVPMGQADLALLVEDRFAQLGDRLVSAVQFTGRSGAQLLGGSEAMIAHMAREANDMARPLAFTQVVERKGLFRSWSIAGCCLGLLLGFGILQPDLLNRWFHRNVLLADVPWPQSTYVKVQGEDFVVLRGDDLKVVIEVEDRSLVTPSFVELHAEYTGIGWTEERIDPDPDNPRRFVKVFPAVPEEFRFYVTANDDYRDARKPYHRVTLIDPPSFRKVIFSVIRPSYTESADGRTYDGSAGVLSVPAGARIRVDAQANKPLSAARMELDGRSVGDFVPRATEADGGEGAEAAPEAWFVGEFELPPVNKSEARVLRFALRDEAGNLSRSGAKYLLQIQQDHAPILEMRKSGVGVRISPRAMIPLRLVVRDDYGIASVGVSAGGPATDPNAARKTIPVALPPSAGKEATINHVLDIEPMAFKHDQTIYISAFGEDKLPESFGGPNRGRSGMMSFTVVKPEELMDDFVRRQKELRLEFEQAMRIQETARATSESAAAIFAAGRDDAESRQKIEGSAAAQSNVGAEMAKAADTLAAIVEEMKYNRVGTDSEREQIRSQVVEPIKDLQGPIREVRAALGEIANATAPAVMAGQARAVESKQRDLLARMEEILQRMAKLESKQEMANKLQLIIEWSQELLKAIEAKRAAETGNVFDTTTKPADDAPGSGER